MADTTAGIGNRPFYKRQRGCALIGLTVIPGGVALIALGSVEPSERSIRTKISRELPMGTSRTVVREWLDANGFLVARVNSVNSDDQRHERLSGVAVSRGLFGNKMIEVYFDFDENGGLSFVSIEVYRLGL